MLCYGGDANEIAIHPRLPAGSSEGLHYHCNAQVETIWKTGKPSFTTATSPSAMAGSACTNTRY